MERMTPADVHHKTDHRPHALAFESAALGWLAEPADGAPVVPVLNADEVERAEEAGAYGSLPLLEPTLTPARPDEAAAEAFGRLLARTHAAGAPWFGAPPAGWVRDGAMGNEALPLRANAPDATDEPDSWGAFYGPDRIAPYLPAARANGSLDADDERTLRRLVEKLASGALDHAQPALIGQRGNRAARIHGDLWSGNVLWTRDVAALPATDGLARARAASDTVGVLIDPAAHGGHAESDLAQLFVFGAPHAERTVAAYAEVSPFDGGLAGARERRALHQLHILVVHAALFGGGYGRETMAAARAYL